MKHPQQSADIKQIVVQVPDFEDKYKEINVLHETH